MRKSRLLLKRRGVKGKEEDREGGPRKKDGKGKRVDRNRGR